jgi:hypothetical protein
MGCVASSSSSTTRVSVDDDDPSPQGYGGGGWNATTTRVGARNRVDDWTLPKKPYRVADADDADGGVIESRETLARMRDEFWETKPAYGGSGEVWAALRAACEGVLDVGDARLALKACGVVNVGKGLAWAYDESGWRYVLPLYVRAVPDRFAEDDAA